jgi:hypothetical protein
VKIRIFRLSYALALAAMCSGALVVPAAAVASSGHRAHIASQPCRFYRNVRQLINDVSHVPADSLTLDECGVALASVCAAEQYNSRNTRNVPFYRNQIFYRSCEHAYRFLRSGYLQRSNRASDCGAIGWAAVLISPFVPVESIGAKLLALAVGVSFKLNGC